MAEEMKVIAVREILLRLVIGTAILVSLAAMVTLFVLKPYILVGLGLLAVAYGLGAIARSWSSRKS